MLDIVSMRRRTDDGTTCLSALQLVTAAGAVSRRPASSSADKLFALGADFPSAADSRVHFTPALASTFPHVAGLSASRLRTDTAQQLWSRLQAPDWPDTSRELLLKAVTTPHSAGVIAADSRGDVAVVLHSCNCSGSGSTALFAGGVSIQEVAGGRQQRVSRFVRVIGSPAFQLRSAHYVSSAPHSQRSV
jgi:hypothetical protein